MKEELQLTIIGNLEISGGSVTGGSPYYPLAPTISNRSSGYVYMSGGTIMSTGCRSIENYGELIVDKGSYIVSTKEGRTFILCDAVNIGWKC